MYKVIDDRGDEVSCAHMSKSSARKSAYKYLDNNPQVQFVEIINFRGESYVIG